MPLTGRQRRDLLRIERSRDAAAITAAINQVLADNPTADLLDIEMAFRAAACASYLVARYRLSHRNRRARLDRRA